MRAVLPEIYPVWVRISATDWLDNSWDTEQSIALADKLKSLGVDLIDEIIRQGVADRVLLGRVLLREPYGPHRAAKQLGHDKIWPVQYERAWV